VVHVVSVIVSLIGVILIAYGLIRLRPNSQQTLLIICALIGAGLIGGAFWAAASAEDNSLLNKLGDEPQYGVVVHIEKEQFCFVLVGDEKLSCIDAKDIFNLTEEALDVAQVSLSPGLGYIYSIEKAKRETQQGVLLELVASPRTNTGREPCELPSTGGGRP